jgi:hypothetical protein
MIGAAVVGVAGVALGSYFGLHAMAKNRDASADCPAGRCTSAAEAASESATSSADLATVSFVIGAAGLGAATYLLFTRHPTPPPVTASVSPSGAWIGWRGAF